MKLPSVDHNTSVDLAEEEVANMNDELLDIVDSLERCYESWREQVVGILDEDDTNELQEND